MFKRFFSGLAKLIYPPACLVCKTPISEAEVLCQKCLASIKKLHPPFCNGCGKPILEEEYFCKKCNKNNPVFKRAWSVFKYEGVAKECIHLFKYSGKLRLTKVFKELTSEFIRDYHLPLEEIDFIVPVPLHKSRLREREFNQSELIAQEISKEFSIALESKLIKRIRNTVSQIELPKENRSQNVRNAFEVSKGLKLDSKNVLIVDDVLTTGATAGEIAITLRNSGVNDVYVLTLAQ